MHRISLAGINGLRPSSAEPLVAPVVPARPAIFANLNCFVILGINVVISFIYMPKSAVPGKPHVTLKMKFKFTVSNPSWAARPMTVVSTMG